MRDLLSVARADAKERVASIALTALVRGRRRCVVEPFEVIDFSGNAQIGEVVGKLLEAANLIRDCDARRYISVLAELKRIVLLDWHIQAARYYALSRTLVLQRKSVEDTRISVLASMLVHEATHGRIYRRGVAYIPRLRSRIERLCLRNEVWFLRRVQGAELLLSIKMADLAGSRPCP